MRRESCLDEIIVTAWLHPSLMSTVVCNDRLSFITHGGQAQCVAGAPPAPLVLTTGADLQRQISPDSIT